MTGQWLLVGGVNVLVALLAAAVWARARGPEPADPDDITPNREALPQPTGQRLKHIVLKHIVVVGPLVGVDGDAVNTAAALRAARARSDAVVTATTGTTGPGLGTAEAIAAADLVVLTEKGDRAEPYLSMAAAAGAATIVVAPLADDPDAFERLAGLHTARETMAFDVALGPEVALATALEVLRSPGEHIIDVELSATLAPGAAHYEALDSLLLAGALLHSDVPAGDWRLELTEAPRPAQAGIITTDTRKIEWRYDGEVGSAIGAVTVTPEIETSTEVRVRIDPVQQFQHAIDAALAFDGPGEPYPLTRRLLQARQEYWAVL